MKEYIFKFKAIPIVKEAMGNGTTGNWACEAMNFKEAEEKARELDLNLK